MFLLSLMFCKIRSKFLERRKTFSAKKKTVSTICELKKLQKKCTPKRALQTIPHYLSPCSRFCGSINQAPYNVSTKVWVNHYLKMYTIGKTCTTDKNAQRTKKRMFFFVAMDSWYFTLLCRGFLLKVTPLWHYCAHHDDSYY